MKYSKDVWTWMIAATHLIVYWFASYLCMLLFVGIFISGRQMPSRFQYVTFTFLWIGKVLITLFILAYLFTVIYELYLLYKSITTNKLSPKDRQKFSQWLFNEIPFLGIRISKFALFKLYSDKTPASVRVLAEALNKSKNPKLNSNILKKLSGITEQTCIDEVCEVWNHSRHRDLTHLLVEKNWVASAPINIRVLSALKTRKLQVITNGGKEIVEPLLNAFRDKDSEIANRASECATMFDQPEYKELLFRLVLEQDHPIARQVVIKAQYAPREPSQRAVFYFLTEQWDKYESLDYEYSLLQTAFEHSNEQLRQKITEQIRKAGRVEWLKVFAGGNQNRRLGEMTNAEWETTLTILDSGKQWGEMWGLAQKAPAIWSKKILQKLKQIEWVPEAKEERKGFERLIELADTCSDKPDPIYCKATYQGNLGESVSIYKISLSLDGKILACEGRNKIYFWSMSLKSIIINNLMTPTINRWHDDYSHSISQEFSIVLKEMSVSPDGKILATCSSSDGDGGGGSHGSVIILWQLVDMDLSYSVTTRMLSRVIDQGLCRGLSFSPDGKILACMYSSTVDLWSIPDGKFHGTLVDHDENKWAFFDIEFTPNGKLASLAGSRIKLWSINYFSPDLSPLMELPIRQLYQQNKNSKVLQNKKVNQEEK